MGTVNLTCSQCSRLIAIQEEHVGKPVRCPYCQTVLQLAAPSETLPSIVPDQRESLSDEPPPGDTLASSFRDDPAPLGAGHGPAEEPLPSLVVRRPHNSLFVPLLLLFLIPYCLAATGFIVYLLYQQQRINQFDPLERLPDPKPKEGARQVQHDLELPEKLRTTLGRAVKVGALEVTAKQILATLKNDQLVLVLDMHNVSEDQEFNPIHEEFAEPKNNFSSYIFLEPKSPDAKAPARRLYGGKLQWALLEDGTERPADQKQFLRPGQHMLVRLTSREKDRESIRWFLKHPQEMIWPRVQVRRGLMDTASGLKSATAVIGVEFNSGAVDKM